jgi:hypothetical protein
LEGLTDQQFVTGMGYQYKIGGHGNSEVILTDEDEYGVFLERVQKAPKGTGVLIRPTSTSAFPSFGAQLG